MNGTSATTSVDATLGQMTFTVPAQSTTGYVPVSAIDGATGSSATAAKYVWRRTRVMKPNAQWRTRKCLCSACLVCFQLDLRRHSADYMHFTRAVVPERRGMKLRVCLLWWWWWWW